MKPKVYVETSVIGHLSSKLHADQVIAARQLVTREWWNIDRDRFSLRASQVVIDECHAGEPQAAADRLKYLEGLEIFAVTTVVADLARVLIARKAIPATEPRDALHISLAAVNRVEYLVTWNFKHIANASTRKLIETVCRDQGFVPPTICTPDELLGI